ncbi:dynein regulatory complex protein 10-like, partial [Argonauta hians]
MTVYSDMLERVELVCTLPVVFANLDQFAEFSDPPLDALIQRHLTLQIQYRQAHREFLASQRRLRGFAVGVEGQNPFFAMREHYSEVAVREARRRKRRWLLKTGQKQRYAEECGGSGADDDASEDDDDGGEQDPVLWGEDSRDQACSEDVAVTDNSESSFTYQSTSDEGGIDDNKTPSSDAGPVRNIKKRPPRIHGNVAADKYGRIEPSTLDKLMSADAKARESMDVSETPVTSKTNVTSSGENFFEDSDVTQYLESLYRHLAKVAKNMANSCKDLVRAFFRRPEFVEEIRRRKKVLSPELDEFVKELYELKQILKTRLLTTPQEEKDMKKYLKEMAEKTVQNQNQIHKLEKELAAVSAEKDEQVRQKSQMIRKLQADIAEIDKNAVENMRRVKAEADNVIATEMKNSESKTQAVFTELTLAKQQLAEEITAHREQEGEMRRRKFKAETEVENWIQKYDQEMGQLQEELENVETIYKEERKQLLELEERFRTLEVEYTNICKERVIDIKSLEEAKRSLLTKIRAATTIQAYWRSYKV